MVLDVRNLKAYFYTAAGVVRAVDGISYSVRPGETIALMGESGCGKSVSALSVMRLVWAPAGRIIGGQVMFQGRDLLALGEESMRHSRGREIAMIFQEPMTSLNPVLSIGRQLTEPFDLHLGMPPEQARQQAVDLLATVGIPDPGRRLTQYPSRLCLCSPLSVGHRLLAGRGATVDANDGGSPVRLWGGGTTRP